MPSFAQPTLTTPALTLRPLHEHDAPRLAELAGAREIARTTLRIPHPYSADQARAFIVKVLAGWPADQCGVFAAVQAATSALVGAVGLEFEFAHKRAELGYWVGVEYWGRGYATHMAREVVRFGFETLGLERIHAHAFGSNAASCRVLEKAGMKREGSLRRHIYKWDQWEDMVVFGVLRQEWSPSPQAA